MRSAFALRIDSGIMILICISAKPAGLAEMLFFTGGVVTVNCICDSDRPLTIAAPLVKMAFVALRRVRQTRNKNNLSSEDAQSNAEHIQNHFTSPRIPNRPLPPCFFWERGVEYSHNQTQGSSCSGLRGSIASFDPFT